MAFRIKIHAIAAFVLLVCLSMLLATRSQAEVGPGHSTASAVGPAGVSILGTSAQGESLSVRLAWSPEHAYETVELILLDETGSKVDGRFISPPEGGEPLEVVFPDFLRRLPAEGFQVSSVVQDLAGQNVSAVHAFRVFFDCPPRARGCRWETVDGLKADSLTMRESLRAALHADGTAAATLDLLTDILTSQPKLEGQVLSLASQLDRLDARRTLGTKCHCFWIAAFQEAPAGVIKKGVASGPVPSGWTYGEVQGRGAAVVIGGQARWLEDPIELSVDGASSLTMELSCYQIKQWKTHKVSMSTSGSERILRFPVMVPCAAVCSGDLVFTATLKGELRANGKQAQSHSQVTAGASLKGVFKVWDFTGHTALEAPWNFAHGCIGDDCLAQSDPIPVGDSLEISVFDTVRSTGTVASLAEFSLFAPEQGQWCLACSVIRTEIAAIGTASPCASEPTVEASLSSTNGDKMARVCGELEINPWEP